MFAALKPRLQDLSMIFIICPIPITERKMTIAYSLFVLKFNTYSRFVSLETRLQELSNDILYAQFRQPSEKRRPFKFCRDF